MPRPRPEPTSTFGGKWRWESRLKTGPSPRAHCRCSAPSYPAASRSIPGLDGVGVSAKAWHGKWRWTRTNILGRGAVKDTCNLLADGIVKLLRALAQLKGINVGQWAKSQGYHRYLGSSVKGEAAIDWADRQARAGCWLGLVGDADRLLELSRQAQGELPEDSAERQRIVDAAELLAGCCSRTWSGLMTE